jgi:hypothetical protein
MIGLPRLKRDESAGEVTNPSLMIRDSLRSDSPVA